MTEADLHRTVAGYLDLALIPPTWWTTFPSDGARWHGLIGLKRGVPDILIVHEGRAHWIELETPGNRKRRAHKLRQSECRQDLRAAGTPTIVCTELEHVVGQLFCWGIPLRAIELVA